MEHLGFPSPVTALLSSYLAAALASTWTSQPLFVSVVCLAVRSLSPAFAVGHLHVSILSFRLTC